jgi:hypothetical protein
MNTITVKIIAWEADGQSLVCKFASDETASSNPDDYNSTESDVYSGLSGTEQTFSISDITPTPSTEGQQVDPDTVEV